MSQPPPPRPAARARSTLRPSQALRLPMRVWDLPTRLFAPAVALATVAAFASLHGANLHGANLQGKAGPHPGALHLAAGYAMLALLLFRVVWGVVGSDTARFSRLLHGPATAARELAQLRRREPDDIVGHSAVGGWWLALALLVMAATIGTGFASAAAGWHAIAAWSLAAVVAAQAAVLAASRLLLPERDLWRQMLTGKKRLPANTRAPRLGSPILAFAVLAVIAAAVAALALRG